MQVNERSKLQLTNVRCFRQGSSGKLDSTLKNCKKRSSSQVISIIHETGTINWSVYKMSSRSLASPNLAPFSECDGQGLDLVRVVRNRLEQSQELPIVITGNR